MATKTAPQQTNAGGWFIVVCLALILIEVVHFVHRITHPIAAPEISVYVVASNTVETGTAEVKYPTNSGGRIEMATYYDQFCVDVNANPAGSYLYDFSVVIERTYDHQKFFGGTERRTITIHDTKDDYRGYENSENPYCFAMKDAGTGEYRVTAKNEAGESTESFLVRWIEGCSTMGTIRDGDNKWTKCDENSSYNEPVLHPERYDANGHLKPEYGGSSGSGGSGSGGSSDGSGSSSGSGSGSSSSGTGNSSGGSSSKPTANSSGLTSKTAENVCAKRLQQDYELDDILGSSLSGNTWEVELTGLHEGSTHDSMIYVECHVTGTNSSPRITYYNEDVYKDYYINDDGYYEDCYYGYDYATGQCR